MSESELEEKPVLIPDAPHGTLAGWTMGCRCTCCTAAKPPEARPKKKRPDRCSNTGQGQSPRITPQTDI